MARRYSWSATRERCRQLASALATRGVGRGDTVAVLLSNIPEMLEAHFGIPMTGAVLVPLNTRLDAAGITFILEHCEAKVLLVDRAFSGLAARAVAPLDRRPAPPGDRGRLAARRERRHLRPLRALLAARPPSGALAVWSSSSLCTPWRPGPP
jgi:acyl-CoA synthetase (AMP-forming)/AMP-acid ligase II